jgi:hypothetical protein
MAGVAFDPDVVREQADTLDRHAGRAVRSWVLLGTIGGFVSGAALFGAWSPLHAGTALVGIGSGYVIGLDRARRARVEAQMLLCQLNVEEHTRAWIAQSRLALSKLTAAVEKLPVEAPRPSAPVAAAPVAAPTGATPAAATPVSAAPAVTVEVVTPARPVDATKPVPARNTPQSAPSTEDDETPSWAVPEAPRAAGLQNLEYLIVAPADAAPRSEPIARDAAPPLAAAPDVAWETEPAAVDDEPYYEANPDALDDDAWLGGDDEATVVVLEGRITAADLAADLATVGLGEPVAVGHGGSTAPKRPATPARRVGKKRRR